MKKSNCKVCSERIKRDLHGPHCLSKRIGDTLIAFIVLCVGIIGTIEVKMLIEDRLWLLAAMVGTILLILILILIVAFTETTK